MTKLMSPQRRCRSRRRERGLNTYQERSLTFLNNRHYDPTTGMFVSVDPLVAATMQPYIYGSANPVTYSDPTGLCSSFSGTAENWTCDFHNPDQTTIISGDEVATYECRSSRPTGCNSPAPKPPKPPKPPQASPKGPKVDEPGFFDRLEGAATRTGHVGRFVLNVPLAVPSATWAEMVGGDCSIESGAVVVCTGVPGWANGPADSLAFGAIITNYDKPSPGHLEHETNHLTQSATLGPFFVPMVIGSMIVSAPIDVVRGCTLGTHSLIEATAGPGGGYGC